MNAWPPAYRGNLEWLIDRTIFYVRHGSHAYGLNIETSDEDFKGIAIPPAAYLFGFLNHFEQAESKDPDTVIYDLRKFCALATDCNPSIIEVLFVDDRDVLHVTPAGERLRAARRAFLSKKAKHTYSGYALQQLKRIKNHHRWLKNPPKAPPSRGEFALPERTVIPADQLAAAQAAIAKKLEGWELSFLHELEPSSRILVQNQVAEVIAEMRISTDDRWRGAARTLGFDDNFLDLLDRERRYTAAHREWEQFRNWIAMRNPARAELEARYGYDTKHGMHLVRLMRMCRELLTTGDVIVRRPDREELLSIRSGAWSYERLVEWAEREDAALSDLAKTSTVLPNSPDRVALDKLCQEIVAESLEDRK